MTPAELAEFAKMLGGGWRIAGISAEEHGIKITCRNPNLPRATITVHYTEEPPNLMGWAMISTDQED